jgi:hypothetical protein
MSFDVEFCRVLISCRDFEGTDYEKVETERWM